MQNTVAWIKLCQAKINPKNSCLSMVISVNKSIKNRTLLEIKNSNIIKKRFNSSETDNFLYFEDPNKSVKLYKVKTDKMARENENVYYSGGFEHISLN